LASETIPRVARLRGRSTECDALDRLLKDAQDGRSGSVVLRGEAGVGKSALLLYAAERASDWHVARTEGVESEMELAYSGLHQLCASMLDRLHRLPAPQRDALAIVFGQESGPVPARFLVGLATLTLFAEVAEDKPLICIVDDAQWLDAGSAQIIGFVARRLLAERIALVCAARAEIGDDVLAELQDLWVHGLSEDDARALLLEHLHGPLDAAICEQIIVESRGNPLALLELPRSWSLTELAGGFGLPGRRPIAGTIEQGYARRLELLPAETQLLVLVAAADPFGDLALLHRAAETLGVDIAAVGPAQAAGLLKIGARVEFAHPLVRSAAYRSAAADDRQRVHCALATATDADHDPDRRAWHRAEAAVTPSEEVAAELEASAGRARARGGLAAAGAFLERAAALTADRRRRTDRALAAAHASFHAGAFETARRLAASVENGTRDESQRAQAALIQGQIAFASGAGGDAAARLLQAANQLQPFDETNAREVYLTAWRASLVAAEGAIAVEICRTVLALDPPRGEPRPTDLLLEGLARRTIEGLAAGVPLLRRAAKALDDAPVEDVIRWGWVAAIAHGLLWDVEGLMDARHAGIVRNAGALAELPIHLTGLGVTAASTGDFARAAALAAEEESVAATTGSRVAPYILLRLRALQGRESDFAAVKASVDAEATAGGLGGGLMHADWAAGVLYNGVGRYAEAAAAAERAASNLYWWGASPAWALPELIEAAARLDDTERARAALERLAETTQPLGTDYTLGIEARSRALLESGDDADRSYREAIDRLERTPLQPEIARAYLLYGEWLRMSGRRVDARSQLRTAYDLFTGIGMEAFAERARRELLAAGDRVRRRSQTTRDQLTPQEKQIARLAREGLTNAEIGAMLYLSPRTVEWHLRKVFTKLGITSRGDLRSLTNHDRDATLE
jgi:DNA-binding CsgD family transcriptional regulator/tetratricopeptide (TPR) repeat protein